MALGFFRRRQKMVFIIMVVLMVAFLVPGSIRGVFQRNPRGGDVGEMGDRKVTLAMLQRAASDLQLLQTALGMGYARIPRRGEPAFEIFLRLNQGQQPALTWALLVEEARRMDLRVTKAEVDAFLEDSGLSGKVLEQYVAKLNSQGYEEASLRQAVADHLLVTKGFEAAYVTVPPSLPELQHLYQRLREEIQLAMVIFPADDFLKDAPAPTTQAVDDQFARNRNFFPGQSPDPHEFGFGYCQPDQADVAWLFLDRDNVRQAVEPGEQQMSDYWLRHRGEITTQAADDGQGGEPGTIVVENYADAKPIIREHLKEQVVENKMNVLLARAREVVESYGTDPEAYVKAAGAMTHPADALLARPAGTVPFKTASLATVIERLERLTGVKVVYPFGKDAKLSVDGKVTITIEPVWSQQTLGQVLDAIGAQLKIGPIHWATLEGFENTVFPAEPVNLLPVRAGITGLAGLETLAADELLGSACLSADRPEGETLVTVVAGVFRPPDADKSHKALIEVGEDFRQAMHVVGKHQGRLLWRLRGIQPAHTPDQATPAIRRQVEQDLRTVAAMQVAEKAAGDLKTKLDQAGPSGDLEKLAAADKRKFVRTEPFVRQTVFYGQAIPANVPEVGRSPLFIEEVFSLVPADPEPPHLDRPSKVVPLPRKRMVVLVQRIGYVPATYDEFAAGVLARERNVLSVQRQLRALDIWFAGPNVQRRVEYKPRTAAEGG